MATYEEKLKKILEYLLPGITIYQHNIGGATGKYIQILERYSEVSSVYEKSISYRLIVNALSEDDLNALVSQLLQLHSSNTKTGYKGEIVSEDEYLNAVKIFKNELTPPENIYLTDNQDLCEINAREILGIDYAFTTYILLKDFNITSVTSARLIIKPNETNETLSEWSISVRNVLSDWDDLIDEASISIGELFNYKNIATDEWVQNENIEIDITDVINGDPESIQIKGSIEVIGGAQTFSFDVNDIHLYITAKTIISSDYPFAIYPTLYKPATLTDNVFKQEIILRATWRVDNE